jgi:hypothetical protein
MTRRLPVAVAVLGWLLVAGGVLVFWRANRPGAAGWTGYTGGYEPLQSDEGGAYRNVIFVSDGWTVLWTGGHLAGAVLVGVGLLVLAVLTGWLVGRRTGRPRTP